MIYPKIQEKLDDMKKNNLQIQVFGLRINKEQTVGEYLLEFLLVFNSEYKGKKGLDKTFDEKGYMKYKVQPNVGLKRFIFFEKSKLDKRYRVDEDALMQHNKLFDSCIDSDSIEPKVITRIVKDMLYGFNLVTKQRAWFAQSMMPIAENLIFCEAMGKKNKRDNNNIIFMEDGLISTKVDQGFEFKEHNFMARGGEVYFLHLMQGYEVKKNEGEEIASRMKNEINTEINTMVNSFPQFREIANLIQDKWLEFITPKLYHPKTSKSDEKFFQTTEEVIQHYEEEMSCQWIKEGYRKVAKDTFEEVHNLMTTEINEFEKMELLNTGIIFQIIRMMISEAYDLVTSKVKPMLLLHFPSNAIQDKKIKQLAVEKFNEIEKYIMICLANHLELNGLPDVAKTKKVKTDIFFLNKAYDDGHKLIRKLGKQIGFITPLKGSNMRFTLSDKIVRFLVLAIVEPNKKITLDTFIRKLYSNYGIVIREEEYTKHTAIHDGQAKYASYLQQNYDEFLLLLSKNGFLTELSDATAIVFNPYDRSEIDERGYN